MNPACPACAAATTAMRLQQVSCFACVHCKGHYLPGDALDGFLTARGLPNGQKGLIERTLQSPASPRSLTCPACRTQSYRIVSAGLMSIDVCDRCAGLYLDRGEANAYLLQTRATTNVAENTIEAAHGATVFGDDILNLITHLFH